jgi:protein-tyrosine phosphatase
LIREIHPDHLFIGNAMDARDVRLLYDHRIAAVVDLAVNEPPAHLARDMIYCRIPIDDGDGNSNAIITTAVRCVVTLIENDIRTLVACSAGMSRSPAIAAAEIAIVTGHSPDECLTAITTDAPHDVSPPLWARVKSVYNEIVGD